MRAYGQGAFVRVVASTVDVQAFNDRWPCSTVPERRVSFTFDRRNGDLVDLEPQGINGTEVVSLARDCQGHARARGLLA